MTPDLIRRLLDDGRISPEYAAKLTEKHYKLAPFARRRRLRRVVAGWLLAPLRWLGLTRLR